VFRSEVYKNLKNLHFNKVKNLTQSQEFYLKKFLSGKSNFMVLQCDKNIGALIISKQDYKKLTLEYLNENDKHYKPVDSDPLENTVNSINVFLKNLYIKKQISLDLFNNLRISGTSRLGSIRLLPKLHKEKFSVRAIINCINHPTEKLCKFVDSFLKPIVSDLPTVLKDSQDLLQRINEFKLKNKNLTKMYLYSCDFESLYTNIDPKDAANKISRFIKTKQLLKSKHLNVTALKAIITLIFKNNVFKYENLYFLQLIGLPMGCKCGPTIANLYLYIIEEGWVSSKKPLLYGRFIDDIIYCDDKELNKIEFEKHFVYLKLNIVHSDNVAFLDLKISFDYLTNKFVTDLYIKPTNTFSYLLTSSNHPMHIFKNIPKSLFIRIRRICSNYIDYLFHSKKLIIQLFKRGYNLAKITSIARSIGSIDRLKLLPYKNKNSNLNKNSLNLFNKFDKSLDFLKNILNNSFMKMKERVFSDKNNNLEYLNNLKIKQHYSIGTSIGSSLIHGFRSSFRVNKHLNKKCDSYQCASCDFITECSYIKINNMIFPILKDCNCKSQGVVYLISCSKCNEHYIGETERSANKRLSEHIYGINSFKYNIAKSISNLDNKSEVAIHFNKTGHFTQRDLKFYIITKDLKNMIERKSIESDLINIFKDLKIKILNKKQPKMKHIKNICFS
jgi:hypothetical protein